MAKIAEILLNKGSLRESFTSVNPVNTNSIFKQTEKGLAIFLNNTADLGGYGIFTGVKTIVFVIKPSNNTKLFLDNGVDKLEIIGGNYSGTGLTENTVFINSAVDTDMATLNEWQMVISEFSAGISFVTDMEIDPTAELYLGGRLLLFDTILTTDEKNSLYNEFLHTFPLAISQDKFLPYPNLTDGDISFFEDFRYEPADGTNINPLDWIAGTGDFKISELTSDDAVLTHLKKGKKFLSCSNSGTIGFQSKQAYGTWEFDIDAGNNPRINFLYSKNNIITSNGYRCTIGSDESLRLQRIAGAGVTTLFNTGANYLQVNILYRIKITRAISGEFTFYIKGGLFGDNYILVDVSGGTGTNPITSVTYTTSKFSVFDLDAGDRMLDIIYIKGI